MNEILKIPGYAGIKIKKSRTRKSGCERDEKTALKGQANGVMLVRLCYVKQAAC